MRRGKRPGWLKIEKGFWGQKRGLTPGNQHNPCQKSRKGHGDQPWGEWEWWVEIFVANFIIWWLIITTKKCVKQVGDRGLRRHLTCSCKKRKNRKLNSPGKKSASWRIYDVLGSDFLSEVSPKSYFYTLKNKKDDSERWRETHWSIKSFLGEETSFPVQEEKKMVVQAPNPNQNFFSGTSIPCNLELQKGSSLEAHCGRGIRKVELVAEVTGKHVVDWHGSAKMEVWKKGGQTRSRILTRAR